jgi:hypothetical protein
MASNHQIYEIVGITKFMFFIKRYLNQREYLRMADLHTEFLDEHLNQFNNTGP